MKALPKFLPARVGRYRPIGKHWVRITAESCVDDHDIKMLRGAQVVHGYVLHIPSESRRTAEFTRLHVEDMKLVTFAERVTGTLYDSKGRSSSLDLVAEFV